MPRFVRFHTIGAPEVLRVEEASALEPGPGAVRIAVRAIGLNRAEALMRSGRYIEAPPLPSGLGLEASGVIDAIGAGVPVLAVGDAVSVIPAVTMADSPTYGESIIVPAERVVLHPPLLGWEEAAALWMAYLTAYGALIEVARIGPGDLVAITAPSSSVGLAAIAIARAAGAEPIAITQCPAKQKALLAHGAAHVVVSSSRSGALDVPGAGKLAVALDAVGGGMVSRLAPLMAPGGIIIEYGGLDPAPMVIPFNDLLARQLTVRGYLVHELTTRKDRLATAVKYINEGVTAGRFRPVLARIFPFEAIVEAHRFLESGTQFGKVVVSLRPQKLVRSQLPTRAI
ncbi:zinc-dependent alcohol dehydrogenase family protein [Devosia sp. CAU 1758]